MTKAKRNFTGKAESSRTAGKGLETMLDYAIVEGAELRLPLFVLLLRLARLALKEEQDESVTPQH